MSQYTVHFDDILSAADAIRPYAHRTPVVTCGLLDEIAGRNLFFKCENLQKVGAFKFRGACNAVLRLSDEQAAKGVTTHSSGNHAQALALAAKIRGIQAHVVMPANASPVKRAAVEGYGARVIPCQPTLAAREETVAQVQAATGATLIPPYDHPHIIAGQGTAALEFLEEVPQLDAIIVPVGGGGLVSGVAIVARQAKRIASLPTGMRVVRVFAAEPAGADDAARSKQANHLIPSESPNTMADGLLTSLGQLTWPIIRDLVDQVIAVPDEATIHAMKLFWSRTKLIIEPSSAVAVAAVFSEQFRQLSGLENVGIILSGGNVSLDQLPWSGD